jgi:hypothetical protein
MNGQKDSRKRMMFTFAQREGPPRGYFSLATVRRFLLVIAQ